MRFKIIFKIVELTILIVLVFSVLSFAKSRTQNIINDFSNNDWQSGIFDSLWCLIYGGIFTDEGWGVDTDSEGNVYFATSEGVPPFGLTDIYLRKISPQGDSICWVAHWDDGPYNKFSEQAFEVTVKEPYVYVCGLAFTGLQLYSTALVVIAFNTDGQKLWHFTWDPSPGWEEADGLVVEGDYIYVTGWTKGNPGVSLSDIALLKLTTDGDTVCTNVWGTAGWDEANGQIVVEQDKIYVAGHINANIFGLGGDALLATFSKDSLKYLNHITWGGSAGDNALGMTTDGTYLYLVVLTNSFGHTSGQIFLVKYDMDLNWKAEKDWGGPAGEHAREIAVGFDNKILIAGATSSYGNGGNDVALVLFDQNCQLDTFVTWGRSGEDLAHGLVIDGSAAYIGGETGSYGSGKQDAFLLKFNYQTALTVAAPNGGETWSVGSSQHITWTSAGAIDNVKIEYSTDNGTSWIEIIVSTPNDGEHEWIIPPTPSLDCLVRISDAFDENPADISDQAFIISPAQVIAFVDCPDTCVQNCSVTVPVIIDVSETSPEQLLGSYNATLAWDPALLNYTGYIPGDAPFNNPTVNETNTSTGELQFGQIDPAGAAGEVIVIHVNFNTIGDPGLNGVLDLDFSELVAAVTFNNLLPITTIADCSFEIEQGCIYGDVTNDSEATIFDALIIATYDVGLEIPPEYLDRINQGCGNVTGPVEGDEETTIFDALVIATADVGLPVPYPVGEPFCPDN